MDDSVDQLIERHIRRGNLRDALALLERLIAANPDDQRWLQKARAVNEMLQPGELVSAKVGAPGPVHPAAVLEFRSKAPRPATPVDRSGALEEILQRIALNRRPTR